MIVDFRMRPPYKSYSDLWPLFPKGDEGPADPRYLSPFACEQPASKVQKSIDLFISEMDEAGITQGVLMGRQSGPTYGSVPNDEIAELSALYPGRFHMFGGVALNDVPAAVAEIDRIVKLGFKGVAVDSGWNDPPIYSDDKSLYPIYEKCQELDIILSLTSSLFLGPDLTYIEPTRVQHIAADFPNLLIVLPHGGWPYTMEYLGLGLMYNNLWFMPDFYAYLPGIPGADLYVTAANSYIGNRIIFASSYPGWPLKLAVEKFSALPFDDDVLEKALYKNAQWILEDRKK